MTMTIGLNLRSTWCYFCTLLFSVCVLIADSTSSRFHQARWYSLPMLVLWIVTLVLETFLTIPTVPYSLRKRLVMRRVSPITKGQSPFVGALTCVTVNFLRVSLSAALILCRCSMAPAHSKRNFLSCFGSVLTSPSDIGCILSMRFVFLIWW